MNFNHGKVTFSKFWDKIINYNWSYGKKLLFSNLKKIDLSLFCLKASKCYIYSMEHTTRNKNIVLTHNPWGWDRVNPWGWEKGCVKNILKFFRQIIQK